MSQDKRSQQAPQQDEKPTSRPTQAPAPPNPISAHGLTAGPVGPAPPEPDWSYWLALKGVTEAEAAALLVGVEPGSIPRCASGPTKEAALIRDYERTRTAIERADFSCVGWSREGFPLCRLAELAEWALSVGWNVPNRLAELGAAEAQKIDAAGIKPDTLTQIQAAYDKAIEEHGKTSQETVADLAGYVRSTVQRYWPHLKRKDST